MIFLIGFLMLGMFWGCKSPVGSDNPPVQYWAKIEVVYDRDPAKITNPGGNDLATAILYELFDPDRKLKSQNDTGIVGYYRFGYVDMEKIADNKFRGYIEQVLVQTESWHGKHRVYVRDTKLYDGLSKISMNTPYGITVQRAYDIHILSYQLHFKVSKQ